MSSRQAYPAIPPRHDAKCAGCDVAYRRVERGPGGARVVVKARLKMVFIAGQLARLCDKCRKTHRSVSPQKEATP